MPAILLPYVMSCVTLTAIYFAGEKKPWAWLLSLGNQGLWAAWIYLTWPQASGLVPMCLCLTVLYARNFQKWNAPPPDSDPRDFEDARICAQDGGVCWGPCDVSACQERAAVDIRDINGVPMNAGE